MAFGNLSQDDKFNSESATDNGLGGKSTEKLEKFNPGFKTLDQNQFGDKAPSLKDLEDNEKREIKAPNDRYAHFDLKENLKVRSALVIFLSWVFTFILMKVFAGGDPQNFFTLSFAPNQMPTFLRNISMHGGLLTYFASLLQILLSSFFAPLMAKSVLEFIVSLLFLLVLCWAAKFVKVDDMRLIKSYFLCSFGSAFIVYGLYRLAMFSLMITGSAGGTWVQALQSSTLGMGIYGLKIGLVGLWTFVLMQVMFERTKIPAYAEGMEKVKKQRTIALLVTLVAGILYFILFATPGDIQPGSFKLFAWLLVIISLIIGIVRGLVSYSTMAMVRNHGRM